MGTEYMHRIKLVPAIFSTLCCLFLVPVLLSTSSAFADGEKLNSEPASASAACGGPEKKGCPPQTYCEFPEGSCGKDASFGKCNTLPEICSMEFAPVCGCDEKTYGNTCMAKSKGVAIAHQGECLAAVKQP